MIDMDLNRTKSVDDIISDLKQNMNSIVKAHVVCYNVLPIDNILLYRLKVSLEKTLPSVFFINNISAVSTILKKKEACEKDLESYKRNYCKVKERSIDLTDILKECLFNFDSNKNIILSKETYTTLYNKVTEIIGNSKQFYSCYFDLVSLHDKYREEVSDDDSQLLKFTEVLAVLYTSVLATVSYYKNIRVYIPDSRAISNNDFETLYSRCIYELVTSDYKLGEARMEMATNFFTYGLINGYEPNIIKKSFSYVNGQRMCANEINVSCIMVPFESIFEELDLDKFLDTLDINMLHIKPYTGTVLAEDVVDSVKHNIRVIPFIRDNGCYQMSEVFFKRYEVFFTELFNELVNVMQHPRRLTLRDVCFVSFNNQAYVMIINSIDYKLAYELFNEYLPYEQSYLHARFNNTKIKKSYEDIDEKQIRINETFMNLAKLRKQNYEGKKFQSVSRTVQVDPGKFVPLNYVPDYEDFLFELYKQIRKQEITKREIKQYEDRGLTVDKSIIADVVKGELNELNLSYKKFGLKENQIVILRSILSIPPKNSLKYLLYHRLFADYCTIEDKDNDDNYLVYKFYGLQHSDNRISVDDKIKYLKQDRAVLLQTDIYDKPTRDLTKISLSMVKRRSEIERCKRQI